MSLWGRFGRLPAAPLVAVLLTVTIVAAVTAPWWTLIPGVAALVALMAYCIARPTGRIAMFFATAIPGAAGTLLEDAVSAPRWIVLLFVPLAALAAHSIDQDSEHNDQRVATS